MMRLAGLKFPIRDMLAAATLDGINLLLWQNTKDGHKNRNRPKPILDRLTGADKKNKAVGFKTAEDFERAKQKILQGG